jgi:hypothetical protein
MKVKMFSNINTRGNKSSSRHKNIDGKLVLGDVS